MYDIGLYITLEKQIVRFWGGERGLRLSIIDLFHISKLNYMKIK
jgi:hypothetical protein